MKINKNSMLGRWLSQFTHPLLLRYLESDTFLEYVKELKDLYWEFFTTNYPTRGYHLAWEVTEFKTKYDTEGCTSHKWYDLLEVQLNHQAKSVAVLSLGEESTPKSVPTLRSSHNISLLNNKGKTNEGLRGQIKRAWTKLPAVVEIRKRTLPKIINTDKWDEEGNKWVEHWPLWVDIANLKTIGFMKTDADNAKAEPEKWIDYEMKQEWSQLQWKLHNLLFREACLKWFRKTPSALIEKVWRHFIFEILDRECISLTTKAFGVYATIQQYEQVWKNKEGMKEIAEVAPGLTPLVLRLKPKKDMGRRMIKGVRGLLKKQGMTRSGWRALIKMPVGVAVSLAKMMNEYTHHAPVFTDDARLVAIHRRRNDRKDVANNYAGVANMLSEIGVMPRMTSFGWVGQHMLQYRDEDYGIRQAYIGFCRALFRATKRARITEKWWRKNQELGNMGQSWRQRVQQVQDFLAQHLIENNLTREQLRMPLAGWERMSREWHANVEHTNFIKYHGDHTWDSCITNYQDLRYPKHLATGLVNSMGLAEEATSMHHCVGAYIRMCVDGGSRIFSIKKKGERVTTLELRLKYEDNSWYVGQHLGACNSRIEADESVFGIIVAEEYTKRFQKAIESGDIKAPEQKKIKFGRGGGELAPF